MFWQEPILFAVNQIWFRVGLTVYGLLQISLCIFSSVGFAQYGSTSSTKFALSIQALQNGNDSITNWNDNVFAFSVTRDLCSHYSAVTTREVAEPVITITQTFPDARRMNGFLLKTNTSTALVIRFELQACPAANMSCAVIATTKNRFSEWGTRTLASSSMTISTGPTEYFFDLRAPWPLLVRSVGIRALIALGCLGVLVVEIFGDIEHCHLSVTSAVVLVEIGNIVAAAGYFSIGQSWEAAYPIANVIALHSMVSVALYKRRLTGLVCLFGSAAVLCCQISVMCGDLDDCQALVRELGYGWLLLLFLSGVAVVGGLVEAWSVARELRAHMDELEQKWRALISQSPQIDQIGLQKDLRQVASQLSCNMQPRQFQPSRSSRSQQLAEQESRRCLRYLDQVFADVHSRDPALLPQQPAREKAVVFEQRSVLALTGNRSMRSRASISDVVPCLPCFRHGPGQNAATDSEGRMDAPPKLRGPVRCLNQLYSQGMLACILLRKHGAEWAARAGGVVHIREPAMPSAPDDPQPGRGSPLPRSIAIFVDRMTPSRVSSAASTVSSEEHVSDTFYFGLNNMVRRGWLKHPRKAAGKALACYEGDVSRVVDICRIRLRFEAAEGLMSCLSLIASDSRVEVLRFKNLSGAGSTGKTYEFRGILLNIRIRTPEAYMLGIERHVCEVQLVWKVCDWDEDASMHVRHLRFRNVRATGLVSIMMPLVLWFRPIQRSSPPPSPAAERRKDNGWDTKVSEINNGDVNMACGIVEIGPLSKASPSKCPTSVSDSICAADPQRELISDRPPSKDYEIASSSGPDLTAQAEHCHARLQTHPGDQFQRTQTADDAGVQAAALDDVANGGFDSWHAAVDDRSAMELCRRCALSAGAAYDGQWFDDALISSSSILFTRTPFATGVCKPIFNLVLIGVGVFMTDRFGEAVQFARSSGFARPAPRFVRMTVLGLRNDRLNVFGGNNFTFCVLNNGCPVSTAAAVKVVASGNGSYPAVIAFDGAMDINGYSIQVSAGAVEADPVRWVVEGSEDGRGAWTVMGASEWSRAGNDLEFFPSFAYDTPEKRPVEVVVDQQLSMAWIVGNPIARGLATLFWWITVFFGLTKWPGLAKMAFVSVFLSSGLAEGVSAVLFLLQPRWKDSVWMWMVAFVDVVFGTVVAVAESYFFIAMFAYGILSRLIMLVKYRFLFPIDYISVSNVLSPEGYLTVSFTIVFYLLRQLTLRRARRIVMADSERYGAIWASIFADPGERAQLEYLRLDIEACKPLLSLPPRQLTRRGFRSFRRALTRVNSAGLDRANDAPAAWEEHLTSGTPMVFNSKRPVNSLDQLFCQAVVLNPIFIRKVQEWAGLCGGSFRCIDHGLEGSYLPWTASSEAEREELATRVRWCGTKSAARAAQKANRAYGRDVSYLVDLCRQSIYFPCVEGVRCCLATMARDPEVLLARIKNRMDPVFDASTSAGFRSVSVNLRVVSDKAQTLGVEGHVAEVQLLLMRIADIKNDEGHRRYIAFRNLRGE